MIRKRKTSWIAAVLFAVLVISGCGPQKPKTQPPVEPTPPSIEELRQPVDKDPAIYKAYAVIKKFGRFTQKYMSYEKYKKAGGGADTTLTADWFYDTYVLDMNEKGHWATVTYGTAQRAIARDPRIEKLLEQLPDKSITIKLKTPRGRVYILNDAWADGILDFVKDARQKTVNKIDIELLDRMQKKYTWLIGVIKRNYKK